MLVLAVIGLFTSDKSLNENKVLKTDINVLISNNKDLSIEIKKLKDRIKEDSLIISQKENDIVRINNNIAKIKKDEKLQINTYINSDIDERVRLFTEYATSPD